MTTVSKNKAINIVGGYDKLQSMDIAAIAMAIDFENMKPEFYPTAMLADSSLKARKMQMAVLSLELWGIKPETWLISEQQWLAQIRAKNGNSKVDTKDTIEHVVSMEILTRIYAVAYLSHVLDNDPDMDVNDKRQVFRFALRSLNNFLETTLSKGYARASQISKPDGTQTSMYGYLAEKGIPMSAAGHYLPDPEISFPYLLSILDREAMNSDIYLK